MRTKSEKQEIVEHHLKYGRIATMAKFNISDVTIYHYRLELGLGRTEAGRRIFGVKEMEKTKTTGAGIKRGGKTEEEKRAIISYFDKYGPQPTCVKFKINDRSIYKYRMDLGLPSLRGKGSKKRKYKKKYKPRDKPKPIEATPTPTPTPTPAPTKEPEMLEIIADQRYEGTITLTIPNLKIRAKKVEVIQDE